ncbi:uncharacterized protein [Watersipora subatra]|uniref:uncharacterized protein n=1 Tax=Watersipora subatra TaxID=2589382 RepID=UPI00355BD76B
MECPASISPTEHLQETMEQWIREYISASGAPDITSLKAALTTTPPDQLLQLITTIRDSKLFTVLLLAISRDHPEVSHLLLTPLRGIADELLFEKVEGGYTALHRAVLKGYRELVELILFTVSSGKKYELIAVKDGLGYTALTEAALRGYTEIVETLLISLIKNSDSRTLLEDAESEGRKETVKLLKSWKQPVLAAHAAATFWRFAALHEADRHKTKAFTGASLFFFVAHAAATDEKIASFQQADRHKTKAHAAIDKKIAVLHEADSHKTKELTNQKEELVALKEADSQKLEELANQREKLVESQQQIVALQAVNNQLTAALAQAERRIGLLQDESEQHAADTAAIMERLNRLDIYLRAPTDTDETGDQLHEPLG